jgi:hypothetical protein
MKGIKMAEPMLPEHMKGAMKRYLEDGIEPGGFLYAVLTNDLKMAVAQADHINIRLIPEIVSYCYNCIPAPAWGSVMKVEKWMLEHGPSEDDDEDFDPQNPGDGSDDDAFEEGYF